MTKHKQISNQLYFNMNMDVYGMYSDEIETNLFYSLSYILNDPLYFILREELRNETENQMVREFYND